LPPTNPNNIYVSYSQSWPLPDEHNQVGFTFTYTLPDHTPSGPDDLYLNYTRQILVEEKQGITLSPSFSLILPSGNVKKGLGFNTVGFELDIPVSKRWNNYLVSHFNVGFSFFPKAEQIDNLGGTSIHNLSFFNVGTSLIWLVHRRFNVLTEFLENVGDNISDFRHTNRYNQTIINLGMRFRSLGGVLKLSPV